MNTKKFSQLLLEKKFLSQDQLDKALQVFHTFQREVKAVLSMDHPNLVGGYEYEEEGQSPSRPVPISDLDTLAFGL